MTERTKTTPKGCDGSFAAWKFSATCSGHGESSEACGSPIASCGYPVSSAACGSTTLHLAIVSALVLFLELALIRWLPAHVLYLSFFTNTVLLGSFLGMSLGCLLATRTTHQILRTPFWLTLTIGCALLTEHYNHLLMHRMVVSDQINPDVVFFGTEIAATLPLQFKVPVELIMAVFFLLSAVSLIGPGQELGRAFNALGDRIRAYCTNLLGSLGGIVGFGVCAQLQLPPVVWFALAALGIIYLSRPYLFALGAGRKLTIYGFLLAFLAGSLPTSGLVPWKQDPVHIRWSPYYRVDFRPQSKEVRTNLMAHQTMTSRTEQSVEAYAIPYLFQRDVLAADGRRAWPAFRRVLIIGSGTGNDLSRACQWCPPDAQIDAVEIDPVIQQIGREYHPDQPYNDPRVRAILNDGRNFLRTAPAETYDLVIFALVDSLVLHSGYSSLRLESFLFTEESFQEVRRVLKPHGVCCVYNFFRQGWIAVRLNDQLRRAFGGDSVVLTDPPREAITLRQFDQGQFTLILAGSASVVDPLRAAFRSAGNSYWIPGDRPATPSMPALFQEHEPDPLPGKGVTPPPLMAGRERPPWLRLRVAAVDDPSASLRPATDDWPFLYCRRPGIPPLTWRGIGLVLLLSTLLAVLLRGRATQADHHRRADGGLPVRSFLLGAGFMLVETKAVVHMALLFGSTWMVNTFVFAAVLLMSLAGSLYGGWRMPRNLSPYYIGLILSLLVNVLVPLNAFLGLERSLQVLLACAMAFLPVAFAGVIFAVSFARSHQPDRMIGANVAGALVGGLMENFSMLLGFRYLLVLAIALYAVSSIFRPPQQHAKSPSP